MCYHLRVALFVLGRVRARAGSAAFRSTLLVYSFAGRHGCPTHLEMLIFDVAYAVFRLVLRRAEEEARQQQAADGAASKAAEDGDEQVVIEYVAAEPDLEFLVAAEPAREEQARCGLMAAACHVGGHAGVLPHGMPTGCLRLLWTAKQRARDGWCWHPAALSGCGRRCCSCCSCRACRAAALGGTAWTAALLPGAARFPPV